jgi:hypothetical protein
MKYVVHGACTSIAARDCHGFPNPCGFWVGYLWVRVWVGISDPHKTHTLPMGQGYVPMGQGMYPWVKGMYKGGNFYTYYMCLLKKRVFLPKTTFLACIKLNNKSILQGFRVIVICIHNLIYEKKHTEGHFTLN